MEILKSKKSLATLRNNHNFRILKKRKKDAKKPTKTKA